AVLEPLFLVMGLFFISRKPLNLFYNRLRDDDTFDRQAPVVHELPNFVSFRALSLVSNLL
ncbi:MAG: hypothetical protein LBJ22_06210, partial [Synergistaceae bacterium]|nr:hypothetical protein [Synergistaceae bacterium]